MTTSTLSAASAALDLLLSNGAQAPASSKQRQKKSPKRPKSTPTDLPLDLAEEKRKVEEAVKALNRTKVRQEELEVRERILAMREEKYGKKSKKRKAAMEDDCD